MRRKHADFYREVSPPDSLSSLSNGSPVSVSENPDGTSSHSALPNGEVARNIGRPSPDSPNLKYRNLDRAEANGRTPAEGQDFGYVHDSGSGSARVIPYDSGFTNNGSAIRKAGLTGTLEQSLRSLEERLESRYQGLVLMTSLLSGGDEYEPPIVRIMTVQIPADSRKQGLGSEVMFQIISWADGHGVMLSLSPSTDFGASSVSRLTKFYRRFGFKPNKGRNKDFRTRDTMLRNPSLRKSSATYKMPRKWDREHCESKPCDEMGFSEKASCRPYVDCYGDKTGSNRQDMISKGKQASSKAKLRYLGSESGVMPYDFYFMRVENDYYYHYTYRDRAEEIIEDGFLRPNFYKDQPGAVGAFAISGSYGQEVTSLQVSGSRKDHMDKIVALKFKTRTEPKYGFPEEVKWDKPVKLIKPEIVSVSEVISDLRKNEDLGEYFKVFYDFKEAIEIKKKYSGSSRVAQLYLESAKRDDSKLKNTGHGGLDTWFAGHGGGKPDERATWGDWIAITPIKHTIKKEDGEDKTYDAGDIVGPCAVSSEPSWKSVTNGGKNPLKCMPRDKAHDLTKEQRATLARKKRREESKAKDGQKPVHTPTFSEKGKEMIEKKSSKVQHKINFKPTGNNKLDIALALAHSKKQGFISLVGHDVYEDIIAGILADAHTMLHTRNLDVGRYQNIRPYNISIFQWKKDYERLNVQKSRYRAGNAHIWGEAPKIWVEAATLGAELKVEMEGSQPSIKGEVKVHFPITYTILEDRGAHPYRLIEREGIKFYSTIPIEINLRNSDAFNRLYLSWLEGNFD